MDVESILNFLSDPLYLRIVGVTVLVLIAMMVLWWSYKKFSRKNIFSLKKPEGKKSNFWRMFVYWLKYLFVFPILIFFWFLLLVVCLRVLTYKTEMTSIMFLAIVLVSAIRIASYINESMSEDLAKMLPLALLAAIILSPSFMTINISIDDLYIFQENFLGFAKYLLFIIVLEGTLRFVNWSVRKYKEGKEKRKVSEAD